MRFLSFLATTACAVGLVAAQETITTRGRHFVTSKTQQLFEIKGLDYQPGGSSKFKRGKDPLSDVNICARDVYVFQKLGINVIRVYSIDPDIDHNQCMTLLAMAGIYLVLDVNSPLPNQHLNNHEPWTTYTPKYLEHIFKVVEVFSGYANTLGFLAGNEVIFDTISAEMSPNYVKAVVRDLKAYMTKHVSRIIPVGYSNADDLKFRTSLAAYLECGDVGYIDFWGVNSYQWCGATSFEGSGYDKLVDDYSFYSLPIFFTEFGCNKVQPRRWGEIAVLHSTKMSAIFSGGLAYEYSQESNDYGLVDIAPNGAVTTRKDFSFLRDAYASLTTPFTIPAGSKVPQRPMTCADSTDSLYKNIQANHTLPSCIAPDLIENGVNATRGMFVKDLSRTMTSYKITIDGRTVSKPEVVGTVKVDYTALPSGGHGMNVGGGIGKGAPQSGGVAGSEKKSSTAATVAGSRVLVFVASIGAVAFGFGLLL